MQLKINGKKVFFTTLGSGKQLLILPGWMHSTKSWAQIQFNLSHYFQVTVTDFPGFGESELNTTIKDLNGYAHFLHKVITELGLKNFTLLGQSFGGAVAIKTLSLYPNLPTEKLILVDSAGIKHFHFKKLVGFILAKGGQRIFSLPLIKNYAPQARSFFYRVLKEEDYLTAGPLKAALSSIVKEHLSGILDRIQIPTLIIWGKNDNVTPLSDAKILQQKIKNSKLEIIPNASHWPFLEQPDEFCRLVKEFAYEK